eukprot:jgi/Chlat1/5378/Chrsp35S05297
MRVDRLALVLGFLLLAHAAYLQIQHRSYLKIVEEEYVGPTLQVIVECALGTVVCIGAAVMLGGDWQPIRLDPTEKKMSELPALDFHTFNHRGKFFPRHLLH